MNRRGLDKQTFKDFEWIVLHGRKNGVPDFNKSMNDMIRQSKGELIVSLQDYIEPPEDGLQQFWDAYQKYGKALYTAPMGRKKDDGEMVWDWRTHRDWDDCGYSRWEIDWGAIPRAILYEVGGFDEDFDAHGWAYENTSLARRAERLGYKVINLSKNKAIGYYHDYPAEYMRERDRDQEHHMMRDKLFEIGLKIDYLSENDKLE
jgi:hypothetical protein